MSSHSLHICKQNNTVDPRLHGAYGPVPAEHWHWHCTIHQSISTQTSTMNEMFFFISAWRSAYTKRNHTPIAYFRHFIHIYFTWLSTFLKIFLKYGAMVFYRCKLCLCKYLCSGHSTALSFLQSHCSQSHCNLLFHSDLWLFFIFISFNYVSK